MADRPIRKCNLCDDTGYKDYAGFAMDPCDHQQPAPVAHGMADLLTKAIGDITAALILAGKKDKIAKWTAPYVEALNEYDTAEPAGEELVELPTGDPDQTDCDGPSGGGSFANPSRPASPSNPERLVEALRKARPIVEADLHAAMEQCDADWEGMSREALDSIDAALSAAQDQGESN